VRVCLVLVTELPLETKLTLGPDVEPGTTPEYVHGLVSWPAEDPGGGLGKFTLCTVLKFKVFGG